MLARKMPQKFLRGFIKTIELQGIFDDPCSKKCHLTYFCTFFCFSSSLCRECKRQHGHFSLQFSCENARFKTLIFKQMPQNKVYGTYSLYQYCIFLVVKREIYRRKNSHNRKKMLGENFREEKKAIFEPKLGILG